MATMSIELPDELAKKFTIFCEDIGLSVSSTVSLFATQAVQRGCIPFEIKDESKGREDIARRKASIQALHEIQAAFVGVADELGLKNEDDIQELVNEVRY